MKNINERYLKNKIKKIASRVIRESIEDAEYDDYPYDISTKLSNAEYAGKFCQNSMKEVENMLEYINELTDRYHYNNNQGNFSGDFLNEEDIQIVEAMKENFEMVLQNLNELKAIADERFNEYEDYIQNYEAQNEI